MSIISKADQLLKCHHWNRRIDLTTATEKELDNLMKECNPATFGRDHTDVLDESYRKARKLDRAHFACNFNPERSGLVGVVLSTLLEGRDEGKKVDVELYKLNVYGQYTQAWARSQDLKPSLQARDHSSSRI